MSQGPYDPQRQPGHPSLDILPPGNSPLEESIRKPAEVPAIDPDRSPNDPGVEPGIGDPGTRPGSIPNGIPGDPGTMPEV